MKGKVRGNRGEKVGGLGISITSQGPQHSPNDPSLPLSPTSFVKSPPTIALPLAGSRALMFKPQQSLSKNITFTFLFEVSCLAAIGVSYYPNATCLAILQKRQTFSSLIRQTGVLLTLIHLSKGTRRRELNSCPAGLSQEAWFRSAYAWSGCD